MLARWLFLFLSFILCFLGLQIYRNTTLMDRGYLLQELKTRKKALTERNDYLQKKLSSHLSLNRLEDYARKELGLVNPEKVRFLEQHFSPSTKSSSPPPFLAQVKTKVRSGVFRIIKQVNSWFNILYEKKKP